MSRTELTAADVEAGYLLGLIVEDAKRNLEAAIIEALRPRIRESVEKAVADLDPKLHALEDVMARRLSIVLTVKEMPK